MNYYTKAELDELGYKFGSNFNFQANSNKPAVKTLFYMSGIGRNTQVLEWLEHMLEKSRMLGFPEIPHTVISTRQTVNVSFHFKSALQSVLFTEIANGFSLKGPFTGSITLPSDQPMEKMDAYVNAVKAVCDRLELKCRFQSVDDFRTNVIFLNHADYASFIDEIPKIIDDVNSIWYEVQNKLRQAGYDAAFVISTADQCNLAAPVISHAKQLKIS